MNKKIIFMVILVALLFVAWYVWWSSNQSLEGTSKDEKWTAIYEKDGSSAHSENGWYGYLKWKGKESDFTLQTIQYLENDKVITEHDEAIFQDGDKLIFVDMAEKPEKNVEYKVLVEWEESGKVYKETIILD